MNRTGRFYADGRCMRSLTQAAEVLGRNQRAVHARMGGAEIHDQPIGEVRPRIAPVASMVRIITPVQAANVWRTA